MSNDAWARFDVEIPAGEPTLCGLLAVPPAANGLVLFAHGSGSSRFSPRNRQVAETLQRQGLATLLLDLLTPEEESSDRRWGNVRFDVPLLASRLQAAAAWVSDALYQPETRAAYRALLNLGLTDAVRACHPEPGVYTFWDYQAGAWQKDHGIRIDHILLSPQAADRLQAAGIDKFTRSWEKPSDHVPVWVELG